MPFDVEQIEPDSSYDTVLRSLRKAIIGNADLKASLSLNNDFQWWLEGQTRSALDTLVSCATKEPNGAINRVSTNGDAKEPESAKNNHLDALEAFHDRLELLRLLVSSETPPERFSWCIPVLARFLDYLGDTSLAAASAGSEWNVLDRAAENTFGLLLVLANSHLNMTQAHRLFWQVITPLASLSLNRNSLLAMQRSVIAGLALVPVFLETSTRAETVQVAEPLLTVTLQYLLAEFRDISAGHIPPETLRPLMPNTVPELRHLDTLSNLPLLSSMVVLAAQLLNYLNHEKASEMEQKFFSSPEAYFCMVSLLHSNGMHLLNVAMLNLVACYLVNILAGSEPQEQLATTIIENLFPRIIELLTVSDDVAVFPKFLELPISILSQLCLSYPGVCSYIRNTNVDVQIMLELQKLFAGSEFLKQLHMIKLSSRGGTQLVNFNELKKVTDSSLKSGNAQAAQLELIANYLLLLSVFTSSNEEFRRRIATYTDERHDKNSVNFLSLMVFELVDNFRFLCTQMLLSYSVFGQFQKMPQDQQPEEFLTWFGSNVGMIVSLIDHPIYANTFYLIRSLSRSVSTLRTFFIDCSSILSPFDRETHQKPEDTSPTAVSLIDIISSNYDKEISFDRKGSFISSLLKILNDLNNVYRAMIYFSMNMGKGGSSEKFYTETSNSRTVILLALLANFILDFTSFRYEIVNNDTFLRDLSLLYKRSSEVKHAYDYSEEKPLDLRNSAYELCQVQLGVMQVIKNYLFNENEENRKYVWEFIPLSIIFEKSLYGILIPASEDYEIHRMLLQHKVIAFEILRNATASSSYFSERIKGLYLEFVAAQQQAGTCYIPSDWNDYLVSNLLSYDLFVKVPNDKQTVEGRFFDDDEFIIRLMADPDYVRLIIGINYTEDNRFTNCSVLRKSDLPHVRLLDAWKRLLEVELTKRLRNKLEEKSPNQTVQLANQLNEVKVSVDWILINLTWKDQELGYQIPDKVNFRLLDTVRAPTASNSTSIFSATNIVIEDSDEDNDNGDEDVRADENDTGEGRADASPDEDVVVTPEDRARILYKHGFANILQQLIRAMGAPKFNGGLVALGTMERFDHLNANDLYEKSKTAHHQIILLVTGLLADSERQFRLHERMSEKHPLRRQSNIISARDGLRARQDLHQAADEVMFEQDRDEDDDDEEEEEEASETDENNNTEPDADLDDYWIR